MDDVAVVVVSRDRAATVPLIQSLLRAAPDVAIVVDRRAGERRNGHGRANGTGPARARASGLPRADRRSRERRRSTALYVV